MVLSVIFSALFLLSLRCMEFHFQSHPSKVKLYAKDPAVTDASFRLICGDVEAVLDAGFLDGAFSESYEVSPSGLEYLLIKDSSDNGSQISSGRIYYTQTSTDSSFIATGRKAMVERKQIITSFITSASDIAVLSESSDGRTLCIFGRVCMENNESCSLVHVSTEFRHKWILRAPYVSLCSIKDHDAFQLYTSIRLIIRF